MALLTVWMASLRTLRSDEFIQPTMVANMSLEIKAVTTCSLLWHAMFDNPHRVVCMWLWFSFRSRGWSRTRIALFKRAGMICSESLVMKFARTRSVGKSSSSLFPADVNCRASASIVLFPVVKQTILSSSLSSVRMARARVASALASKFFELRIALIMAADSPNYIFGMTLCRTRTDMM